MRTENLRAKYAAANPKSTWAQCWLSFFAFLTSFFYDLKIADKPAQIQIRDLKQQKLKMGQFHSFVTQRLKMPKS